jgi:hypothetical protein
VPTFSGSDLGLGSMIDVSQEDWTSILFLNQELPPGGEKLRSKIGSYLTENPDILESQADLFVRPPTLPNTFTQRDHDIVTKESLPSNEVQAKRQNRALRSCAVCGSRSAVWLGYEDERGRVPDGMVRGSMETDEIASRWLARDRHRCICGGSWERS